MTLKNRAKILDLRERCKGRRVIVVGDPHGCYDELRELLDLFEWDNQRDVVVITGDLIDRGPKIKELVEMARYNIGVYTVEGNHEDKFKRWLRGNPIYVGAAFQMTIDQLKDDLKSPPRFNELQDWFESLPQIIQIRDDIYAVHAGINPTAPVEFQERDDCHRIRVFDKEKKTLWFDGWTDEVLPLILFGHTVLPSVDTGARALALDGGCVFGRELRGIELIGNDVGRVLSVKAKKEYYSYERRKTEEK